MGTNSIDDARLIECEILDFVIRELVYGSEPARGAPVAAFEHELHEELRGIIGPDDPPPTAATDPNEGALGFILKAAMEIADGRPPKWLVDGLSTITWEIARGIRDDARYPGRPALRRRLKRLRLVALRLRRQPVSDLMVIALDDLVRRIDEAQPRIPVERGQRKYYPGIEAAPLREKDLCALAVRVGSRLFRGAAFGDKNPSALRACDFIWAAAGGDVTRQWNARTKNAPPQNSVWRGHMRVAKRHDRGPKADVISAIFCPRTKVVRHELLAVWSEPERAYSDVSPVVPADLIPALLTRQQAADATATSIEVVNGWLSGTVHWDQTVIQRLLDCIDAAFPFRPGTVSLRPTPLAASVVV
jgi:hypothetical protein